jgi:hypothetical protein
MYSIGTGVWCRRHNFGPLRRTFLCIDMLASAHDLEAEAYAAMCKGPSQRLKNR